MATDQVEDDVKDEAYDNYDAYDSFQDHDEIDDASASTKDNSDDSDGTIVQGKASDVEDEHLSNIGSDSYDSFHDQDHVWNDIVFVERATGFEDEQFSNNGGETSGQANR